MLTCALFATVAIARAEDAFATRVLFSYGAVESLRAGETDWEFTHAGMALGPHDVVRMPPRSLLRLERAQGDRLDLLTGVGEGSAAELLAFAAARSSGSTAQSFVGPWEEDEVDVLPAGDRREPRVTTPSDGSFDAPTAAAWLDDRSHEHDAVRNLAARVLTGPRVAPYYMPERVATAQALFAAMTAEMSETSTFAALFPDASTATAFGFAGLLAAADIPARKHVDGEGRPFVLLDTGLTVGGIRGVTASRSLYRERPDGAVELPIGLAPGHVGFLQAWYAGQGVGSTAD
ncbi:hypothetical protein HN371_01620 [Candidatus Poribacteria bacterium]|nr:hypothetical protein [Candidatus Poribacteria bacterium]MBT5531421.1 hypothetical protein [Candidatus Poribacteria bacterium]MBT5712805.1 hypothetical protein [Candidatus Poribacteria bacterium]MBT7100104.1 hypothetical protein [Candidatus Poribacteria bacterium]MBT7807755.1 hypothetical protein [Candidatus Poribacteria bacterium]